MIGFDAIRYNKDLTIDAIAEIDKEINLVVDLYQKIYELFLLCPETETMYFSVLTQLEVLKDSLIVTKKSLLWYMENMDAQLKVQKAFFEEHLYNNVFFEE